MSYFDDFEATDAWVKEPHVKQAIAEARRSKKKMTEENKELRAFKIIFWMDEPGTEETLQMECTLTDTDHSKAMMRVRAAVGNPDPFACGIVDVTDKLAEETAREESAAEAAAS